MKQLLKLTGGYKRHMNYLLKLQEEIVGVQNSLFKNLGHDLVLSGCEVTDNLNGTLNIAAGVVYVGGEIVRFNAVSNVPSNGSKAMSLGVPIITDPKDFFDNTVKNIYKETFAELTNVANAAVQIVVKPKLYDIAAYISDVVQSYGQKGEMKFIHDLDGTFLGNFDASGAGTTPKWLNWHRCNGNAGTPNMAGRSAIGVGSLVDIYGLEHVYSPGQQDGQPRHKMIVPEMPSHTHDSKEPDDSNNFANGPATRFGDFPVTRATSAAGGDQPHNNMPPFLAGYWVIKLN